MKKWYFLLIGGSLLLLGRYLNTTLFWDIDLFGNYIPIPEFMHSVFVANLFNTQHQAIEILPRGIWYASIGDFLQLAGIFLALLGVKVMADEGYKNKSRTTGFYQDARRTHQI